jgi:hypothetical protein
MQRDARFRVFHSPSEDGETVSTAFCRRVKDSVEPSTYHHRPENLGIGRNIERDWPGILDDVSRGLSEAPPLQRVHF